MFGFGKIASLLRKDFIQQCRVGPSTGKGPAAQMGKVEKRRWVDAEQEGKGAHRKKVLVVRQAD